MARNPSTFAKRQREQERQRKRASRLKRREARRIEKPVGVQSNDPDFDPDLAGIVPGPQPKPWDDDDDENEDGVGTGAESAASDDTGSA